jgi:hypothetical protein
MRALVPDGRQGLRRDRLLGQERQVLGSARRRARGHAGREGARVQHGCAESAAGHIHMVNLADPTTIYKTITSPLKWQTRVVSCFTDASGFAVGSIEGRCAIQYVEDKDTRSVHALFALPIMQY